MGMAIIVGGHESGLLNSSGALLGRNDQTSNGTMGHGDQSYVNVSNGNLSLVERDVFMPSLGEDFAVVRTYNSRGDNNDANGHLDAGWTLTTSTTLEVRHDCSGKYFEVEYGDGSVFEYRYSRA